MSAVNISRQAILIHNDAAVAEWVRERIPHIRETGFGPCTAFGILNDGALVGGVVFNNWRGFDIHMSAAFEGRWTLAPASLRTLCQYAFEQLGCKRVTAITGKKNRRARKALRVIGFIQEGSHRYGLDGRHDALSFGLLKQDCKWI